MGLNLQSLCHLPNAFTYNLLINLHHQLYQNRKLASSIICIRRSSFLWF
uniref:Uncharacterized protein n=1 Tax=Rhizophora mucronata TaxID=61149 RepID=A0A2P2PM63_RHIMU